MKRVLLIILLVTTGFLNGIAQNQSLKFIAYGDTRTNDDHHREVLQSIMNNSADYDFIINLGDVIDASGGGGAIKMGVKTLADSVIIMNCLFSNIEKRAIQFKDPEIAPGSVRFIKIENCTFTEIGEDAIYIEDHDNDLATTGPLVMVDHITIHNAGGLDGKCIYPKYAQNAVIKNSIVTLSLPNTDVDPVRIYGSGAVLSHFLYMNTDKISAQEGAYYDDDLILKDTSPQYIDAPAGNFTLSTGSPAVGFAEDGSNLGDPRWWPDYTPPAVTQIMFPSGGNVITITEGENQIAAAVAIADSGDIIELTTDGGTYLERERIEVAFPLTIRAAAGLSERPKWICDDQDCMIQIKNDFSMENIIMDGAAGDAHTENGIENDADSTKWGYVLKINNCDFINFKIEEETIESRWQTWQNACNDILGSTGQDKLPPEYLAVPGNHDECDEPFTLDRWGNYLPGQLSQFGNDGKFFVFDYNDARFILLDSDASDWQGEQYDLLKEAAENCDKKWMFAFWHNPILDFGPKEYLDELHDLWGTLLYQNGCDIIFNGHAHQYTRTSKLNWNGTVHPPIDEENGTVQMVCGNGGAPLQLVNPYKDDNNYLLESYLSDYGYSEIDINGDSLFVRHILRDGTVFDSAFYTPNVKPGWTDIASATEKIPDFQLAQNYPNPFNPETMIRFNLTKSGNVKIMVHNLLGQVVQILVNDFRNAGAHFVKWDGRDSGGSMQPSGLYFYTIKMDQIQVSRKMLLVH